ncbi:RM11 protein, partial [Polyodon spathula]|nr:RM11 protein [Polyodon spathula]
MSRLVIFTPGLPPPAMVTAVEGVSAELGRPDRTYDLKINQPTVSFFLKAAAGIEKGAGKTGHEVAGMVTVKHVYEIARVKAQDESFALQNMSLENVVQSIIGSAHSLGIRVVNE